MENLSTQFEKLWEESCTLNNENLKDLWENRAKSWTSKYDFIPKTNDKSTPKNSSGEKIDRIEIIYDYLFKRGILTPDTVMADIGCGPGRFAVKFAQVVKHVSCIDISENMLAFAKEYAQSLNLNNMDYYTEDLAKLNVADMGFEKKYDIVFSSMTPAMKALGSIEKMQQMSRKYCFNASVVYSGDELRDALFSELNIPVSNFKNSIDRFYLMFNLLWLRGFYPETFYFSDLREETIKADSENALHLLEMYTSSEHISEINIKKVLEYLKLNADKDGNIIRKSNYVHGLILWDTRLQNKR